MAFCDSRVAVWCSLHASYEEFVSTPPRVLRPQLCAPSISQRHMQSVISQPGR